MSATQTETSLRQRKGVSSSTSAGEDVDQRKETPEEVGKNLYDMMHSVLAQKVKQEGRGESKEEIDRAVQQDIEKMSQRSGPLPGITNETKAAKDALAADPYNLEKIIILGEEYLREEKYKQAMNVLIRGWKRAAQPKSEIEDRNERFQYLFLLSKCSVQLEKYQQADAILKDVEQYAMPEDRGTDADEEERLQTKLDLRDFYTLECRVHCFRDRMQDARKSFNNALDTCDNFEEATTVWSQTMSGLKKVGFYDIAKSRMEDKAETDEHKKKLEEFDKFIQIKETFESMKPRGTSNYIMLTAAVVLFCFFIYLLWWLEEKSLAALKLK